MSGDLGFNKLAGAVLATVLGLIGIKEASHAVMHVKTPKDFAYKLDIPETTIIDNAPAPLPFPQPEWIAAMDATKGAKVFKKCTSCHSADQGGANKTGPNLWNIVGQAAGGQADFKYSSALRNAGITWDYEALDSFLTKPKKYLPGTNMGYNGIKKDEDRAALIEYLRTNAPTPQDRPAPAANIEEQAGIVPSAGDVTETPENIVTETRNDANSEQVQPLANAAEVAPQSPANDALEGAAQDVKIETGDITDTLKERANDLKDKTSDLTEQASDLVNQGKDSLDKTDLDKVKKAVSDKAKDTLKTPIDE